MRWRWSWRSAVGGVANFFGEGVIGVLERAHRGCVDADVESFESIEIAGGIEEAVDGVGVAALRFGLAENGAVGFGDYTGSVGRVVDQLGSSSFQLVVELS